jgi:toxin ParE1/3/4
MKIIVRTPATRHIAEIYEWIAKKNPAAATRMMEKRYRKINMLQTNSVSKMGRPGRIAGTRELVEYPYIITYRIDEKTQAVFVLSVMHGARRF